MLFNVKHTTKFQTASISRDYCTNTFTDFVDWLNRSIEYYKTEVRLDASVIAVDFEITGEFEYSIRIIKLAGIVEVLESNSAFDPGFVESK